MQEVPSSSGWKAVTPCLTSVELKVFMWTHLWVWLSEKHNTLSLHWLKIRWRHLKTFCPLWNEFNRSHTQCELTHTLLQAGPKKGVCKNQWTGCQTNMQCTTSASMQLMCVFGWCFQTSDATNKKPLQSILHHLNCELQQLKECLQVSWSCLSSLELLCGWQFKSCLSAIKKFTHMSSQHACAQMTDQSVCDTILELLNHPNFHSHPVMSAKARSIKIRKYKKLFQQLQQLPETANLHAKCEHRHWWQTQAWKCYQRNDTCCLL